MADQFANQLGSISPLLSGDLFIVTRDGVNLKTSGLDDIATYFGSRASLNSTLTNASNTEFVDVSSLSFFAQAGEIHEFKVLLRYSSANVNAGIVAKLSTPTGLISAEANSTTSYFQITSSTTTVASPNAVAIDTDYLLSISGFIVPSVTGLVVPQFRSSTSGSLISVKPGSFVSVKVQ